MKNTVTNKLKLVPQLLAFGKQIALKRKWHKFILDHL